MFQIKCFIGFEIFWPVCLKTLFQKQAKEGTKSHKIKNNQ